MFNQALGIAWESVGERNLLAECHFEDLVGVLMHERWSTHNQLVRKDTESVPVCGSAVTHIKNYLGRDVLWRSTKSISSIPSLKSLHESKVCELDEATVLHEDVLWL